MIHQNQPVLDGQEKSYVNDCLETNWISSLGKYLPAFEEAFARQCGCRFGVCCSNGTAALHLALSALEIGFGDEVIVPDYTLIADPNMVILAGAKPVFVDVEPRRWCLDPDAVARAITPRTRALLAVHMYGHPCDLDRLQEIARRHRLHLVEDAAQAHGSTWKGKPLGGFGCIGCYSFYASKTLTTGEGGMTVTNDPDLAEKMRAMRSHGFEGQGRVYQHRYFGFNYRLTNLQAAIGLAQTEKLAEKVAKKRQIAAWYRRRLAGQPWITLQEEAPGASSSWWNFTVLFSPGDPSRDGIMARLQEAGIETRLPFAPLHRQPVYATRQDPRYPDTGGSFPVTERLGEHALSLPSGLGLTEQEVETVSTSLLRLRK